MRSVFFSQTRLKVSSASPHRARLSDLGYFKLPFGWRAWISYNRFSQDFLLSLFGEQNIDSIFRLETDNTYEFFTFFFFHRTFHSLELFLFMVRNESYTCRDSRKVHLFLIDRNKIVEPLNSSVVFTDIQTELLF